MSPSNAATSMSLSQLRAFLTAARAGSFTAAAAELGVAQASVSELIRRLEEDYAVTLFRRGRRLALTPAGTELLPFAERSVSAAESGAHALRRSRLARRRGGDVRRAAQRRPLSLVRAHPRVPRTSPERPDPPRRSELGGGRGRGRRPVTSTPGIVVLPVEDEGLADHAAAARRGALRVRRARSGSRSG